MILQIQNINYGFSIEKRILKNVSLTLEEKNIFALMGSNGAGKTTLFNIITGYLKPQDGKIFYRGRNITNQVPYKINRLGIGRTFQDLRFIKRLSVKENVILAMHNNPHENFIYSMLPKYFYGRTEKKFDAKANEIIEQFFLGDVQNSPASDISYGQQKLLSLACCVANDATLLLIDEAVAGVQPEYRNKIALLIKQLKDMQKTILLIEHNSEFIANVADKIFFLHEGNVTCFDSMDNLKKDKLVMEAYT